MGKKGKKFNNPHQKQYKKTWPENSPVKAKKHLGQHFLKDEEIAQQIANTLLIKDYRNVIEIGPGTGVLTKYLLEKGHRFGCHGFGYRIHCLPQQ